MVNERRRARHDALCGGGGPVAGAVMPVDGFLRLLMVRSQAGSGLRGSIWGPRLEPSLTSQQWRLQSTNAVYWGGSPARGAASSILWMQIQLFVPQRLLQSLKVFQAIWCSRRRRWGELWLRHWGWPEAARQVADCDIFSGSCRESAVCAAECH